MAEHQIRIKVSIAWWLRFYLLGVVLFSRMTRLQPDEAKLKYWMGKAIGIKVVR